MSSKPLNPQIVQLLNALLKKEMPPVQDLTPEAARETRNPVLQGFGGLKLDISQVANRTIPGPDAPIPIRIYTPAGSGPFPMLLYFHGGGWVIGNLDTHDSLCRRIACDAEILVLSVDYRLSPDNKYPAGIEDAYSTLQWVSENADTIYGDPSRIAVGGDSAGGNMATVVCMMTRDRQGPEIVHQTLIYPVTDISTFDRNSYQTHGEGYLLTKEGMIYYASHYIAGDDDRIHPYVSPLLAEDLSGLPPALMVAAEYDVLKDEGLEYAERLKSAGVPVTYLLYADMIHAFFNLSGEVDDAASAIDEVCDRLKSILY